jgi:predicted transcriptional regulator
VNPLELASRYVVPSVMRRLVEILVEEHGLSRVEVARRTGLSPAAVTRYLKGERGSALDVRGIEELDRHDQGAGLGRWLPAAPAPPACKRKWPA